MIPIHKELMGIDTTKFNLFHWVLISNRDDVLSYIMESYFNRSSEAEQRGLETQILKHCMQGHSTQGMYKLI
jgi:hypothetical protein